MSVPQRLSLRKVPDISVSILYAFHTCRPLRFLGTNGAEVQCHRAAEYSQALRPNASSAVAGAVFGFGSLRTHVQSLGSHHPPRTLRTSTRHTAPHTSGPQRGPKSRQPSVRADVSPSGSREWRRTCRFSRADMSISRGLK